MTGSERVLITYVLTTLSLSPKGRELPSPVNLTKEHAFGEMFAALVWGFLCLPNLGGFLKQLRLTLILLGGTPAACAPGTGQSALQDEQADRTC